MIKNSKIQLIFYIFYLFFAFFGIIQSLGFYNFKINFDFYIYYTNLSNYICAIVIIINFIHCIKNIKNKKNEYFDTLIRFNFMCLILIMITFFVYNILLTNCTIVEYFSSFYNVIMHFILPIMFFLNWILFYEHGKIKWYYPLLGIVMPMIYVIFILIRGVILKGSTQTIIYPYFFLNVNQIGLIGVIRWVFIFVIIFVLFGYILYLLDNIKKFLTEKL